MQVAIQPGPKLSEQSKTKDYKATTVGSKLTLPPNTALKDQQWFLAAEKKDN